MIRTGFIIKCIVFTSIWLFMTLGAIFKFLNDEQFKIAFYVLMLLILTDKFCLQIAGEEQRRSMNEKE